MAYDMDFLEFWKVNDECMRLKSTIPRVPASIYFYGDWICGQLKLDNVKYYSDFNYQQENRLKCSEITYREIGYSIYPDVDFGVVMDASIYGGKINYESDATPTLNPVIRDVNEIDTLIEKMNTVDIIKQGLVPKYLEWRSKIKSRYGINLVYGGSMKGCGTMLGQLCGITNFLTWIVTNPNEIRKLISCWLEISKKYIFLLRKETGYLESETGFLRKETGYPESETGFSFYSDITGLISPTMYRDFIMQAEKELYDLFAPNSGDKRFYHADSHMLHQLELLREIGVNSVNIDPYIEPADILEKMKEVVVFGQIPPMEVLLNGRPENVIECVKRDIGQAGPSRHLVVSTVGSINPGTPFDNLKAMFYAIEKFGYIY